MATSTVDISEASRDLLRELAAKTGQTTSQVLDKALAAYRREVFFQKMNAGYAELRADPQAWAAFEAERKQFDGTLMDGLEGDDHWSEEGVAGATETGPNGR